MPKKKHIARDLKSELGETKDVLFISANGVSVHKTSRRYEHIARDLKSKLGTTKEDVISGKKDTFAFRIGKKAKDGKHVKAE